MPAGVTQLQQPRVDCVQGCAGNRPGGYPGLLHRHCSGQPPVGDVHPHPPLDQFDRSQKFHIFTPSIRIGSRRGKARRASALVYTTPSSRRRCALGPNPSRQAPEFQQNPDTGWRVLQPAASSGLGATCKGQVNPAGGFISTRAMRRFPLPAALSWRWRAFL